MGHSIFGIFSVRAKRMSNYLGKIWADTDFDVNIQLEI